MESPDTPPTIKEQVIQMRIELKMSALMISLKLGIKKETVRSILRRSGAFKLAPKCLISKKREKRITGFSRVELAQKMAWRNEWIHVDRTDEQRHWENYDAVTRRLEAIRMHVELDYGVNAIGIRLKTRASTILRWLKESGIYRTGHRTRDHKRDGYVHKKAANRIYISRVCPFREPNVLKAQKAAWPGEWRGAHKWDDERHWNRHRHIQQERWLKTSRATYAKRKNDPAYRIVLALRHRMWKLVTNRKIRKAHRSMELVGCSRNALMAHLQKQFKPGMSWNNYGTYWVIDHKRPCASFNFLDPAQQRQCFHYTNLQPLTSKENRAKHDWHEGKLARHTFKNP